MAAGSVPQEQSACTDLTNQCTLHARNLQKVCQGAISSAIMLRGCASIPASAGAKPRHCESWQLLKGYRRQAVSLSESARRSLHFGNPVCVLPKHPSTTGSHSNSNSDRTNARKITSFRPSN